MTGVFLTVLRMSATGSAVILAVLLVRLILKKAPKRWSWALWLVVLFRLLTPFGIPLSVSLPELPMGPESAWAGAELSAVSESPDSADLSANPSVGAGESSAEVYAPDSALNGNPPSASGEGVAEGGNSLPASAESAGEDNRVGLWDRVLTAAPFVWLAGAAVMAGWNLASYRMLKARLAEAVSCGAKDVLLTDRVDSAFVVGLIRPRIYLPTGLTPVEQACVAAHERVHIRRGDPWLRLLSFLALTVHWFNPLVWLAFSLSGKDMELSCDEAVLNRAMDRVTDRAERRTDGQSGASDSLSDDDIRAAYARTLVKFASRGRIAGPALAFGEGETTGRVKNVMRYRKPVLWVSVAAAVVLVLSGVVLAVNLTAKDTSLPFARYSVDEVVFYGDERTDEILSHMLVEIAGDGSVWTRFDNSDMDWYSSDVDWNRHNPIEPIETHGLTEFIREQTGVKIVRITDAYRHANPESTSEWLFFSTASGDVFLASCRTELGVMQSVVWLARLTNEFPASTFRERISVMHPDFMARSLTKGVGREINCFHTYTEDMDSEIVYEVFTAGASLAPFERDHVVYTPGVAVFQRTHRNAGMKLLGWGLADGWTAESESWDPTILFNEHGLLSVLSFSLPDMRNLSANITLPERKTSFFGKTEYVGECSIRFAPLEPAPTAEAEAAPSQSAEAPKMTAEELEEMYERQEAERQKALEPQYEESLRRAREQIDAAYDAFLAEHYELEDMTAYLAAYASRRIDLNGDGWNELVVYRMPTESSYPVDIYEYSRKYDIVRAFHTTLEGIPASLNADPSGFWCAQIGAHDPDLADGFYGDFFTINDQTYLISMDGSEFWKKVECHAFTTVSGSLAAQTVFSAERCGASYYDEAKRNRSFVNGQEIPFDGYFDALTDWRETWREREGGSAVILWQKPLWDESENSGWPIWYPWPDPETAAEQTWSAPDGVPLFRLIFPAGWEDNVIVRTGGAWADDPENPEDPDAPVSPVPLRIDFYDRLEQEKNGIGLLGSLALYRHAVDRFYPTRHEELTTLTTESGESYDLVLTYPGDMQYWNYRDHYTYWQVRLRSVALRVQTAEGIRETIAPERAMRMLHDALVRAYENIYGPFEPLYADPTPEGAISVEDSLWLRWVTTRLVLSDGRQVGAWEDEDYYWFPIIFPFAVDKRSGAIYKVYNGLETVFYPFDPEDPNALGFAG
ncbi:MAG: hypothetical protein E7576_11635 [Ruminococcaceae bacterium]|nr:hypothetical protein [Oscillospiraceae bacterium]